MNSVSKPGLQLTAMRAGSRGTAQCCVPQPAPSVWAATRWDSAALSLPGFRFHKKSFGFTSMAEGEQSSLNSPQVLACPPPHPTQALTLCPGKQADSHCDVLIFNCKLSRSEPKPYSAKSGFAWTSEEISWDVNLSRILKLMFHFA